MLLFLVEGVAGGYGVFQFRIASIVPERKRKWQVMNKNHMFHPSSFAHTRLLKEGVKRSGNNNLEFVPNRAV